MWSKLQIHAEMHMKAAQLLPASDGSDAYVFSGPVGQQAAVSGERKAADAVLGLRGCFVAVELRLCYQVPNDHTRA